MLPEIAAKLDCPCSPQIVLSVLCETHRAPYAAGVSTLEHGRKFARFRIDSKSANYEYGYVAKLGTPKSHCANMLKTSGST
jgi:hypothetical protein